MYFESFELQHILLTNFFPITKVELLGGAFAQVLIPIPIDHAQIPNILQPAPHDPYILGQLIEDLIINLIPKRNRFQIPQSKDIKLFVDQTMP